MRKVIYAACVLITAIAAGVAVPAMAHTAPARHSASSKCWPLGWRSQNHESLETFATSFVSDVATILKDTAACKRGGWGRRLVAYLNKGNLHAPMPDGVMLWPRKKLCIDCGPHHPHHLG